MRKLRHSLVGKLLAAELAVIVAGSVTLALVALLVAPTLFHRHVRDALGFVPPTVMHHLDEAFGQSLAVSLGLAIAAAAVTAAAVSWLLANRIVRPLTDLAGAAEHVSHGDYTVRVTLRGDDELAAVSRAFNEMAGSLASAEERRRRLLSDLAHELRTPLATIDAYLEGLADGIVPAEPSTWQLLRSETGRLNRLGEDIAKVSRAEERQLDLRPQRTRPETLLAEAIAAARQAYENKGVALELATNQEAPAVSVDGDRMAEVLANLLDNALRHTPAGGTVVLLSRRDGDAALLSVSDTGDGLEPAELERIFERFYRSDPSRSRDRGGSGIGLTIARALVEAHDGRLWAESDGPGTGTQLLCRLPAASSQPLGAVI